MFRPSAHEVALRQHELQREAAEARLAAAITRSARRAPRVTLPFGLRLAPAR